MNIYMYSKNNVVNNLVNNLVNNKIRKIYIINILSKIINYIIN